MAPHPTRFPGCIAVSCALALAAIASPLAAAPDAASVTPAASTPDVVDARKLTNTDAVVLGLVEGVTEYLPVSSTGHLILSNRMLGLDAEEPVAGRDGKPVLVEDEDTGAPVPFTLKDAADTYSIVIQGGAILAVAILYWRSLLSMAAGFLGRSPQGLRLARNLIVAFIPAAILGKLLGDRIQAVLFGPWPVVAALAAGGAFMFWVDRRRHGEHSDTGPELHEMTVRQSLMVGLLQCVALWPGTSRSMMTMAGGYLAGLSVRKAAEFSFLLGFITLSAASAYKTLKHGDVMLQVLEPGPVILGIVVATVAAAVSVKWLVGFLSRHGLVPFAWYRIALSILLASGLLLGWF